MRSTPLLLACALGCGPKAGDPGDDAGTGDDAASADDGVPTGDDAAGEDAPDDDAGSTASTIDGGDGEADGTTAFPEVCDPSDTLIGPAVAVTIRNDSLEPLFVTQALGCVIQPAFAIELGGGPLFWTPEACVTCDAVLSGACGCPALCAQDTVVRIDPGGSYLSEWTGATAEPITLRPACVHADCGARCTALFQAEAGRYVARVRAGTIVSCDAPSCECLGDPDPAGWCTVAGQRGGDELVVEGAFAYPDTTEVELLFDQP